LSPPASAPALTISELAARSGVAPSALRYYESLGLLGAVRTAGNQRRYARAALRRVAVVRAARAMGVPLTEVVAAFAALPAGREPTAADWARMSRRWHDASAAAACRCSAAACSTPATAPPTSATGRATCCGRPRRAGAGRARVLDRLAGSR